MVGWRATHSSNITSFYSLEMFMNRHSHASILVLSTLVLSHVSLAAPKPSGPGQLDPRIIDARNKQAEAVAQQLRFKAVGLSIPPAPPNGGLCVIETTGLVEPPVGQTGASGSYRLYEIQTWVVSPVPTLPGQIP